jgi:rod shape-determining protein MreB
MYSPISKIRRLIQKDLAVDLGTANTLIYLSGEGVILNEPTVIVLSDDKKQIEIGQNAKKYLGRTPKGMYAIRPMKDGVISDYDAMTLLIKIFLEKAKALKGLLSPRTIICVPSDISPIEKKTVLDAAYSAGLKNVYLMEEVMAGAIGSGLPVENEGPFMIGDIGGGTSEVAVISKMAYIYVNSVRIAGDEMDEAVARWFFEKKGLKIGLNTAENVKWEIGSAIPGKFWDELQCKVGGLDLQSGIPKTLIVSSSELRDAFNEPLIAIKETFENVLKNLPSDIIEKIEKQGIIITGGGSMLRGLSKYLEKELKIKFIDSVEPLATVVLGAGKVLEDFNKYQAVFIN